MNKEIGFNKSLLKCHVCKTIKEHIQITENRIRIGTEGEFPVYRDLSLYACEDCGSVRIITSINDI